METEIAIPTTFEPPTATEVVIPALVPLPDQSPVSLPRPREVIDWIRSVAAANRRVEDEAPVNVAPCLRLQDEVLNGSLYICTYGHTLALAFHGPRPFITRWYNWAVNTAVVGPAAQLNWYLGKPVEGDNETVSLAYICPPKREDILKGLALQFRWEIIRDREIAPVEEKWDDETEGPVLILDDARIDRLAAEHASAFMAEHIKVNSIILARPRDVAHIYEVITAGRAESAWGCGRED